MDMRMVERWDAMRVEETVVVKAATLDDLLVVYLVGPRVDSWVGQKVDMMAVLKVA